VSSAAAVAQPKEGLRLRLLALLLTLPLALLPTLLLAV
jgi:hypothetical protein